MHDSVITPQCVPAGQLLPSQMRKVLMTPDKVQSQLRKAGYASLEAVLAAVMEPDGRCSVIPYGRCCFQSSFVYRLTGS
jgi:uncharacterized membrane protein YcaP (DUF421 family)